MGQAYLEGEGGIFIVACLRLLTIALTTHPFRDEAPFLLLLLIETPPTFGRSLRFFYSIH